MGLINNGIFSRFKVRNLSVVKVFWSIISRIYKGSLGNLVFRSLVGIITIPSCQRFRIRIKNNY